MTNAQKESAIKKINERAAEIGRQYGKDSPEYEAYRNAMERAAGDYLTRSGNISHGKKAVENIPDRYIDALLGRKTYGQTEAGYREGAEKEGMSPSEYREMVNSVKDFAKNSPADMSAACSNAGIHAGRNASYEDLKKAIEEYNKLDKSEKEAAQKAVQERHFSGISSRVGSGLDIADANPFKTSGVSEGV